MRVYSSDDAEELFTALADERVWEHIPRAVPVDGAALDVMIQSKVGDGGRITFAVYVDHRVVGMTSVLFDAEDPEGVEIGGT